LKDGGLLLLVLLLLLHGWLCKHELGLLRLWLRLLALHVHHHEGCRCGRRCR